MIRLRPCSYNIHVGPSNPLSGVALAMIDSTGSAMKGLGEIVSSMSSNFKKEPSILADGNHFRDSRAGTCLKGICRTSSTLVRAPIHMGVAFTQGLHNAPSIWGDNEIRPLESVRDFPSGLKAGAKVSTLDASMGRTHLTVLSTLANVLWCLRWHDKLCHIPCL